MTGSTPSQTVGPFLSIGLTWDDGSYVVEPGTGGGFWLRGRVLDGNGDAVLDALVESWQVGGGRGFGRSGTETGEYQLWTVKPDRVPDGTGGLQAPHLDLSVFARGLLQRVVTRLYFGDESDANDSDAVLTALPAARRATLLAMPSADGYRLDVVLQGDHETVFFEL